jgi:NAD(P)H-dependent flavin oxidoreductase YrpB (nitropropane dioxygenase family)
MLRTRLCDVLGIETPLVLAPFGPWDQVTLAAAVSNAGGLGSVGTAVRSIPEMRAQWAQLTELTDRPFAINHTGRPFDEAAFAATLDFPPRHLVPHGRSRRAHRASPGGRHSLAPNRR